MTIILFLVDTSASMCQKAYVNGVQKSYLDIAKAAVETFLKFRQRSQDCMGDRYMLLTFEDPPCNVKAGWKENHATFMNELKNLQSTGLTSMGEALKNAFDLLNLNRMQSGIDTYGQGRCPFYLEPSVIIVITDGGKYSFRSGIHAEITLPLHAPIPGAKLTKEPFRWDQRLFSLVLRMSGHKNDDRVDGKVPHDDSQIEKMCEVTGGRSYRVKSHYVLNQCIESLVLKVQPGVVVHFEQLPKEIKDGEGQDITFQSSKKMIYVHKHPTQKAFQQGFWPIPEPYWPDPKSQSLPPRDAHPKIRIITPCTDEPMIARNFPIDKYEVEPSPLTLQILSKREPNKCWPVLVANGVHGLEMPFGYLKANANFTQVFLMVLPYNYPVILPLLNELFQRYMLNPPIDWVHKFTNYIRSIPQYYGPFLRRALMTASVPYQLLTYILPENLDNYLSSTVANYLKQMKNTAKIDQENLCMRVLKQLKTPKTPYHQMESAKLNCGLPMKRDLITHPQLKETFSKLHSELSIYDNYIITIPFTKPQNPTKNYRNPFDIYRCHLIDDIAAMRDTFFKFTPFGGNIHTRDAGHCLPISEMGNYQEYLKNKATPLREIEPTNVRQHMFGNPYKKDKHMVMVDEADLNEVAPMKPNSPNQSGKKLETNNRMVRKRKAGPIPKHFMFKQKSSLSGKDGYDSSSSISDTESISDASSTLSDTESLPSRLVVDFDYNNDDFPMNGNNYSESNIEESYEPLTDIPVTETASTSIASSPLVVSQPLIPNSITIEPLPNSNATVISNSIPVCVTISPITAPVTSTSTVTVNNSIPSQPTSVLLPSTYHNDMNDPTEISKILQQCHNGVPEHKNSIKMEVDNADETNESLNDQESVAKPQPVVKLNDELNDEQKENIRQQNLEIRSVIFKDIRRPGRDYSQLLEHLSLIQGNFDTKFNFIQMCITESLRFRRKRMADSIQEWWEKQVDVMSTTENPNCPSI